MCKDLNLVNIYNEQNKIIHPFLENVDDLNNYYINYILTVFPDRNLIEFYKNNAKSNVPLFEYKYIRDLTVTKKII